MTRDFAQDLVDSCRVEGVACALVMFRPSGPGAVIEVTDNLDEVALGEDQNGVRAAMAGALTESLAQVP